MTIIERWEDGLRLRSDQSTAGSWILRRLVPVTSLSINQAISPGTALGTVAGADDWPSHLHLQWVAEEIDADSVPGACRPERALPWLSLCPDPSSALGLPIDRPEILDTERLRKSRESHLAPSMSLSYEEPLTFTRGYGPFLVTPAGDAYLDLVNNVCHVGHAHPEVVSAGMQQMKTLNTNTRYLHPKRMGYVQRLLGTFPTELDTCFLVCSGSEANELALRMARAHTGGKRFIAVESGYHGNTQATLEVSSYKFDGPGGAGRPEHVHLAPIPDPYCGRHRAPSEALGSLYADYVALEADAAAAQGGLAAFICESIQSCGGQVVLPDGYLEQAYKHVRAQGGLCIADEVQVGFGRAGTAFWAFETQNVIPDIVTLGKPIGNGHPIAAVVTRRDIAESLANGMEFFNTFGGNPVSCAIADAVLTVLQRDQLQAHAERAGARFLSQLNGLKQKHPLVGDVRGLGLFLGIEFIKDEESRAAAPEVASYVAERMKEERILISVDGPRYNVLKIKPPLVIKSAELDRVAETLDRILGELA